MADRKMARPYMGFATEMNVDARNPSAVTAFSLPEEVAAGARKTAKDAGALILQLRDAEDEIDLLRKELEDARFQIDALHGDILDER